uniref:Polysaccharide biosynthesis domain-containing protein n=1 Tax=Ciona savignyi TaxID=51511 RepID=H2Z069_CIOSA
MDPNSLGNDRTIEVSWAMKASDEAEMHYNLITSVDPSQLQLSKEDQLIYTQFRKSFPELDIGNLQEADLKSPSAKENWRKFCRKFDGVIDDFNYGTLLRLDPLIEYAESNTVFATRIQFLAVEIARNKEGLTTKLYQAVKNKRLQNEDINQLSDATKEISVTS